MPCPCPHVLRYLTQLGRGPLGLTLGRGHFGLWHKHIALVHQGDDAQLARHLR